MRLERKARPEQVGLAGKEPRLWLLCRGWTEQRESEDREACRKGLGILQSWNDGLDWGCGIGIMKSHPVQGMLWK